MKAAQKRTVLVQPDLSRPRLLNPADGGHKTEDAGKGSKIVWGLRQVRPSWAGGADEHNKAGGGKPKRNKKNTSDKPGALTVVGGRKRRYV